MNSQTVRHLPTLWIALSAILLGGCSLSWFGGRSSESAAPSDESLCASKAQIVANRTYHDSWQACERLAAKGDHKAEYVLGLLYTDKSVLGGFLDPETRFDEGIRHIRNAADHNIPAAQRFLGEYYEKNGQGDLARSYLSRAADLGDPEAMIGVATSYETAGQCSRALPYYEREITANRAAAEGWIYLYLMTYNGCGDLKSSPALACGYYHNALNSSAHNTVLSLISYEKSSGTAAKNGSITRTTAAVQEYYKKNLQSCVVKGQEIRSRLLPEN